MHSRDEQRDLVSRLRTTITDEICVALGISKTGLLRRLLGPVFFSPAQAFARLAAQVDQQVQEEGVPDAAQFLLKNFVDEVQVKGAETIPHEGPLLVASNHPGAYDSIAILSNLPRQDIKIIVSDVPFLHSLPTISGKLIYARAGLHGRMAALRSIVRQMQQDGAVLIFPTGLVDADPEILPEQQPSRAEKELGNWSSSLELILRKAPQTRLLVTMVSGVLAPSCLRNPLTRLPKEQWQKQKLAEFLQVIQQLALGRKFDLKPRLSFDFPLTAPELLAWGSSTDLQQTIIARARQVLRAHLNPEIPLEEYV
jgi:hypothetical protein